MSQLTERSKQKRWKKTYPGTLKRWGLRPAKVILDLGLTLLFVSSKLEKPIWSKAPEQALCPTGGVVGVGYLHFIFSFSPVEHQHFSQPPSSSSFLKPSCQECLNWELCIKPQNERPWLNMIADSLEEEVFSWCLWNHPLDLQGACQWWHGTPWIPAQWKRSAMTGSWQPF